jgi:hypothetical protein
LIPEGSYTRTGQQRASSSHSDSSLWLAVPWKETIEQLTDVIQQDLAAEDRGFACQPAKDRLFSCVCDTGLRPSVRREVYMILRDEEERYVKEET